MTGSTRHGRPGPPAGRSAEDYTVELAASLIYLNRTGYNGLFRLNRSGGYNVPVGRYLRPHIVQGQRLRAAAAALSAPLVTIACAPFDAAAAAASPGAFVYFDPPYAPLGRTANFRNYTARGFSDDDQSRLQALAVVTGRPGGQGSAEQFERRIDCAAVPGGERHLGRPAAAPSGSPARYQYPRRSPRLRG